MAVEQKPPAREITIEHLYSLVELGFNPHCRAHEVFLEHDEVFTLTDWTGLEAAGGTPLLLLLPS